MKFCSCVEAWSPSFSSIMLRCGEGGGLEWPWVRNSLAYGETSCDTVVFDYIQFSKFHTHNGDDTLPRFKVFTVQHLRIQVFWDVGLCRWVSTSQCLVHIQGHRVKQSKMAWPWGQRHYDPLYLHEPLTRHSVMSKKIRILRNITANNCIAYIYTAASS